MDTSVEAVYCDLVLEFNSFLVEEGGGVKSVSVVLITLSMNFLTLLVS